MFSGIFGFFTGIEESGISSMRKCVGIFILLVVGAVFLIFQFKVIEIWEVESESMVPVFEIGDRLVKVKTSNYEKGDILVFYSPDDPTPMVKRLVGVEGDKVEVYDGTLYVNGKQMYPWNRYRDYPIPRDNKWKLAEGELFMAGDNQLLSEGLALFWSDLQRTS